MFEYSRVCPKCNGNQFGEGTLSGDAAMMPIGKIFTMGSIIIATVCTTCGHIIEMKVENPEKFANTKKNRL